MARAPTPFVIFATQRTGSSFVSSMLRSHDRVETYAELFQRGATRPSSFGGYVAGAGGRRPRVGRPRTFAFLDELYAPRPDIDAVGFKLMYDDLKQHPTVVPYLALHSVHVIHLVRTNLLDILVSIDTARARGAFHSKSDLQPVTVSVDPATVVRRLRVLDRRVRGARALLALIRAPRIEVSYEQLVSEPGAFADLLRFLRVASPDAPLSTGLRKLNTVGKQQTISNYSEVERALAPTRFARFLDS